MSKNIINYIESIENELDGQILNKQRKRHLIDELDQLKFYLANHPEVEEVPSSLELYCEKNPDARECKIFNV
jgi:hypothetical protein